MNKTDFYREQAEDLLAFIDASPSPWHAVGTVKQQLDAHGFVPLEEQSEWALLGEGRYYVVRGGSSIIAFIVGSKPLVETGFKIIGAHTDSPGLRVKPNASYAEAGLLRVGVEVYGSPILATYTDRDLSLAGSVSYKDDRGAVKNKTILFDKPLLRLPNLAIHMNNKVNEEGLKLDKQTDLPLVLATVENELLEPIQFKALIADQLKLNAAAILSWELCSYDTQKGVLWGLNDEFIASSQLDNLASCHAAVKAFLEDGAMASPATQVCAFFDHEEIGSESSKGASGSFLPDVLMRMCALLSPGTESYFQALSQSFMMSVDMAHAYQPSFSWAYEPKHRVMVNKGPVIKVNANQRYATDNIAEAMCIDWCQQAGVSVQKYSHRTNLGCGSTIGPIVSAKLGIRSVDLGNPMWAMHSLRESAGVKDHGDMIKLMRQFLKY
ncbi:MAG: M18 family aminopeptidase [Methylococcales bacterium]|jgi:aspartyl aminopeptidase|nr:M18 family aminopeptidase [Methylococcaceae bacterium]HIL41066.1 M18 family aminopeptidase [Methylococcales bacterium]